jgi:hypothetical protein
VSWSGAVAIACQRSFFDGVWRDATTLMTMRVIAEARPVCSAPHVAHTTSHQRTIRDARQSLPSASLKRVLIARDFLGLKIRSVSSVPTEASVGAPVF